jgi:benzylsuccinate CoA-transferase BbsF subunit
VTSSELPLSGVRVLDLSWVLAGPAVGRLLADAGAEVIKIESRARMDNTRLGRPLPSADETVEPTDRVPLFHALNAGKQSVGIDLRQPAAVDILKRLASVSDVVVENFAPGVLSRLGVGYEVLSSVNPSIILLSMSGTGQSGPLSDVTAYAPTVSSLAGLESLVGYPGEEAIGMLGANFADSLGGLYGFLAVLTALWARGELGVGQLVDYSEMDGVCTMMAEPFSDYFLNREVMPPSGNCHRSGAPYGIFPSGGEDSWIALAVVSDGEWAAMCQATQNEEWASDPRYLTAAGRRAASRELREAVASYTVRHDRDELVRLLRSVGIAASPVYATGEQQHDEFFWSRGLLERVDGVAGVGETVVYGSPWRLSATPVGPRGPAPRLGQHTRQVLGSLAGLSESELDELFAAGAVS